MEMKPVSSSNLQSVGYDPDEEKLVILFKRGGTYTYEGVSQSDYDGLMSASSVGQFFNENIKNVYPFTRGG